ncbi:hypothetical protein [Virgibacillus sp. DJP39]|uniref:hypothetical protein n=1 Tax=Virgibacillus sp. DJP39 TaxID=3409790 RepID=UPI003BB5D8F1
MNTILIGVEAEYVDSCGNSTRPKTPEEVFFASEEAEAEAVESEVFCRNGVEKVFTTPHFTSTSKIKKQQNL